MTEKADKDFELWGTDDDNHTPPKLSVKPIIAILALASVLSIFAQCVRIISNAKEHTAMLEQRVERLELSLQFFYREMSATLVTHLIQEHDITAEEAYAVMYNDEMGDKLDQIFAHPDIDRMLIHKHLLVEKFSMEFLAEKKERYPNASDDSPEVIALASQYNQKIYAAEKNRPNIQHGLNVLEREFTHYENMVLDRVELLRHGTPGQTIERAHRVNSNTPLVAR